MLCRLGVAVVLMLEILLPRSAGAREELDEEAARLGAEITELSRAGRHMDAVPLAQRALAISEELVGAEHPGTATSLTRLAELYSSADAHAAAEPLYQRALAIREKAFGAEAPSLIRSLSDLGSLYDASGAYAKAEPLLQRALALSEKTPEPTDPTRGALLNDLAKLYLKTAAYAKAGPLAERALALNETELGPEHPATATALGTVASLHFHLGAYAKCEPLFLRALAINESALGAEHRKTADALNDLAELYRTQGAYAKAEPLYQRSLAINRKVLGPEHQSTAIAQSNLALLYQATGAYSKAEPLFEHTLAIMERALGPEHPNTSIALNNLAALYFATGGYIKAEPLYVRSLAIREKTFGPQHPATGALLNNLALLYSLTRQYSKAEPLYERALTIGEQALGAAHPGVANLVSNFAEMHFSSGAYAKAEPLFQRALTISQQSLGPEHRGTGIALNNLGTFYRATGTHSKAVSFYQRALSISEAVLGPRHPDTATTLHNLAIVYGITDAYAQAAPLYARAQSIDEDNRVRFLLSGSESRKQQYVSQTTARMNANITFSLSQRTTGAAALGLTDVLRHKGRALDAMSNSIAQLRSNATPQDEVLFDRLTTVAQELSGLIFRGPGKLSAQDYRRRLDALDEQRDALQAELSSRSIAFAQALAPVTLDNVRQALPANTVLVEWCRYRPVDPKGSRPVRLAAPRYVAYVLARTGEPVAIDVGDAQPIEDLIAKFRDALTDPTTASRGASRAGSVRRNVRKLAAELSRKLVEPLSAYFSTNDRLLISPDGALNLVPFAALLDAKGQYLAERLDISYLTSGRDLLRIGAGPPARSGVVVLAAPDYGAASSQVSVAQATRSEDLDRSGLVFNSLPGTAAEAQLLQSLLELDLRQVLTGERATEAQLRALDGPRILHLATHGFFLQDQDLPGILYPSLGPTAAQQASPLGENPLLRSGLALAGANERSSDGIDDGILTAAEVAQLDLLGTQLVVLSACETALGTVAAGEGVYGLRRALVLAGAQSQLVSLWKVDDAATQSLMVDYYARLLKGEGRAAALRAVQRSMLADPDRQHPYYWAAFIPIGNWTPLTSHHTDGPH